MHKLDTNNGTVAVLILEPIHSLLALGGRSFLLYDLETITQKTLKTPAEGLDAVMSVAGTEEGMALVWDLREFLDPINKLTGSTYGK